ncbi:TauD/TfdA dioxygenase family protein [Ralstonia pseudosolanacearum]|uniref:TauD/TfdA family dioxygenase n=1 Tax=Ralstonia solanacearum TaxID=305 RepID=A0AA92K4X4_RALSL|nr:TauD/TfdA family dioxygenase [Ralstonia pseudosolanacearum]QOK93738.1 TauD/TfdA family dioxygenase [Ralstonia pseudosolanacearum]QOK98607.1 TauD/TfdA family dioxygenase [Ralstonia pseudosolanacearum]UWD88444.1 TauD/TfdA family dioxygenase [Ralstonia pseudosolanacearum]CAH0441517.1 Alpha-ketoglutarate-dependent 2,4-dichlorophenoxyacetate dioxygenase [Ralstonia pseudosolanacearum]
MADASILHIRPFRAGFGAEIEGFDAGDALSSNTVQAIRAAWLRFGVLVFSGQMLDPVRLVAFTRHFGEPVIYTRSENACAGHPEVLVLSNVVVDGKPIGAPISSRYWHSDGHFLQCPPAGTLLYGKEVPPEGGDTCFVDMRAAYRALPEQLRTEIDGRTFLMDRVQTLPFHYPDRPAPPPDQKLRWPDMPQPVVRTHSESKTNALYIGGIVPWRIVGMEPHRSDALMAQLHAIAFDEQRFGYRHRWRAGDLLMWDNRRVVHRATTYDMARHRRLMYRTTIAGDLPFYAPEKVEAAVAS